MKRRKKQAILFMLVMLIMVHSLAFGDTNVALNKTVSLNTSANPFFNVYPDSAYNPALPATVVDNIYVQNNVDWKNGTVFWADTIAGEHWIEINLGTPYTITGFKVQANENDFYNLYYLNSSNTWTLAWLIPQDVSHGSGMPIRDVTLSTPIITSKLKFEGYFDDGTNPLGGYIGYTSDNLFSVSEIQAYGSAATGVPEPATMFLLGLGLMGLAGVRRTVKI